MKDLIERLEKATGPDRGLDAEIHWLVTGGIGVGMTGTAPAYTGSLDVAMTLVPERRARRVEYCPAGSWPYRVWIFRDQVMPLDENSGPPVLGKTEPLATCLAALKSRSLPDTEGKK